MATCVNEDKTTSNNPREMSHHSSTDHNETLDVDADFDLDSLEEISSKSQLDFNSDCELSMDDQDEPLISDELFSSNNDQSDNFLHFYTTTKTRTFFEQLFNKRLICIRCHHNLSHNDKICNKCFSKEKKSIASIFDVNQPLVFTRTLVRLSSEIEDNRKQCNLNHLSRQNNNNDIIFNQVYKELQSRHDSSSFISLLLHLDGINLCKSSKLNLWLLSCSLIELPVHLRYRRFNMIVLSVWIGHREPLHCELILFYFIEQVSDSDDEENSFFDCRKRTKKILFESSSEKRKITIGKPLAQRVSTTSDNENTTMSNKNKSNVQSESNVLQDIDNRVNQLNEKLISNSSTFDQLMQNLYVKIDRLTSNINIHKHALEPYVDKTGEAFPGVLVSFPT
ncbi:unnamed protein product [Rotaria magnacalcarata]